MLIETTEQLIEIIKSKKHYDQITLANNVDETLINGKISSFIIFENPNKILNIPACTSDIKIQYCEQSGLIQVNHNNVCIEAFGQNVEVHFHKGHVFGISIRYAIHIKIKGIDIGLWLVDCNIESYDVDYKLVSCSNTPLTNITSEKIYLNHNYKINNLLNLRPEVKELIFSGKIHDSLKNPLESELTMDILEILDNLSNIDKKYIELARNILIANKAKSVKSAK